MANLAEIRIAVKRVLVDSDYGETEIDEAINDALQSIAGGVLMPDGDISPPLPGLYALEGLETSTTLPYIELPDNYQRKIFYVSDSVDMRIHPVAGGDLYSFGLFMNSSLKKDLSLAGSVMSVCVKGNLLYYQGIPAAPTNINVQYYRKPATLSTGTDIPEGLPTHLAKPILKHYVLKEIFGEGIEDGEDSRGTGAKYHEKKFFEFMTTLIRSIPEEDDEPIYYGVGNSYSGNNW